jgi:hypothetical protein
MAFAYKFLVACRTKIEVSPPVGKWVNASNVRPEESNVYEKVQRHPVGPSSTVHEGGKSRAFQLSGVE